MVWVQAEGGGRGHEPPQQTRKRIHQETFPTLRQIPAQPPWNPLCWEILPGRQAPGILSPSSRKLLERKPLIEREASFWHKASLPFLLVHEVMNMGRLLLVLVRLEDWLPTRASSRGFGCFKTLPGLSSKNPLLPLVDFNNTRLFLSWDYSPLGENKMVPCASWSYVTPINKLELSSKERSLSWEKSSRRSSCEALSSLVIDGVRPSPLCVVPSLGWLSYILEKAGRLSKAGEASQ